MEASEEARLRNWWLYELDRARFVFKQRRPEVNEQAKSASVGAVEGYRLRLVRNLMEEAFRPPLDGVVAKLQVAPSVSRETLDFIHDEARGFLGDLATEGAALAMACKAGPSAQQAFHKEAARLLRLLLVGVGASYPHPEGVEPPLLSIIRKRPVSESVLRAWIVGRIKAGDAKGAIESASAGAFPDKVPPSRKTVRTIYDKELLRVANATPRAGRRPIGAGTTSKKV